MDVYKILPCGVEIKYNYIVIDGLFISTISVLKYDLNIEMFKSFGMLLKTFDATISMHYERKNSSDFLKELTSIISKSSSEIKSVSKNQIDINVLDDVKQNAIRLRKKIQIDNEQIYLLWTYITVTGKSYNEIINKTRNIINTLYSNKILSKPCNFMQKESYIASLPLMQIPKMLKKHTNCIFTENGIAKMFPFYTKNIFTENGTLLGFANNNLCAIDLFSNKNNNYNMCIFGTSGTGKSYFVKLMIMRNRYKDIKQIIIDPEGEYEELVKNLGGKIITLEKFNPFYISEDFVKNNENFFEQKIHSVTEIMCHMFNYNDANKIKEIVIKLYNKFGINSDKNSLYKQEDNIKVYIRPKYKSNFPEIHDFMYLLKNDFKQNNINIKSKSKLNSNSKEKISWDEGLYCFSLKNKTSEEIEYELKIFLPFIYELLKDKSLIYFDEVWKLIATSKDNYIINNIYNMFKTLRKKEAGITIISQDITDLFNVDNGNFGKSILNNSNIRVLFKMEWTDIETFERLRITKQKLDSIKGLENGVCHIEMGSTTFNLEVKATDYEHKLIEGEKKYEENISWNE